MKIEFVPAAMWLNFCTYCPLDSFVLQGIWSYLTDPVKAELVSVSTICTLLPAIYILYYTADSYSLAL